MDLLLRRRMMMTPMAKEYIVFADPEVERICIAKWSSDGIGLTKQDAARVTTLGNAFQKNATIVSFDELEFFVNLASIANTAFENCYALTSIVLPNSVASIGNLAFNNCSLLDEIVLPSSITSIGNLAFNGCTSLVIEDINLPNLTYIATNAFKGTRVKKVSNLGSITSLPNQSIFENCYDLTDVVLPNTLTTIGTATFNRDSALESVTFPNGLTTVGNNGFWGCSSLTEVDLPSTITSIGIIAFANCSGMTDMYIRATTPPTIGSNAFQNCHPTFHVPSGSIAAYEAVLPSGSTIIGI